MFDTRPYTSDNPEFTEEQIKNMLPSTYEAWKNSFNKTYAIELTRRQEETGLQPQQCWWFPWAILRPFFQSKGYTLYQYDPQESPEVHPCAAEPCAADSFGLYGDPSQELSEMETNSLIFGARDSQNRDVVIRLVDKYSPDHPEGSVELQILRLLNSPSLKSDPRNATVPILEFLEFDNWIFAVMPSYGMSNTYPLLTSHECLDFACQVAEALSFMHENRIAHLDVAHENIMMNYRGPLPKYHTRYRDDSDQEDEDEQVPPSPPPEFRSTFPVKYSFIDFGNSAYFLPGLHRSKCLVVPFKKGRPHRAPEVNGRFKHDPFAADVYQTAVMFYSYFGRIIHPEVPGLLEVLQDMSSLHAPDRITMVDAARRLRVLFDKLPPHEVLPRHVIKGERYYYIPRSKFRYYQEYFKWYISEKYKSLLLFLGVSDFV